MRRGIYLRHTPRRCVRGAHRKRLAHHDRKIEEATDGVEHILCPALKPGDVVVMDNLSSHKIKDQGRAPTNRKSWGGSTYLPPYSPDLNPIAYYGRSVPVIQLDVGHRWNKALTTEVQLEAELVAHEQGRERSITNVQKREPLDFARDMPRLWDDPRSSPEYKKRLLRIALKEIVSTYEGK